MQSILKMISANGNHCDRVGYPGLLEMVITQNCNSAPCTSDAQEASSYLSPLQRQSPNSWAIKSSIIISLCSGGEARKQSA